MASPVGRTSAKAARWDLSGNLLLLVRNRTFTFADNQIVRFPQAN